MFSLRAFALVFTFLLLVLPATASAQSADKTGGAAYQEPPPPPPAPVDMTVPGAVAQLLPDGSAAAPADAPPQVQQAVWAANRIQDKPYVYGGGHAEIEDDGYDCSGTVSYALHHGGPARDAAGLRQLHELGRERQGPVDHGLHEPRSRLRGDRRPAAGYEHGHDLARRTSASSRRRASAARAGAPPSARRAATRSVTPSASEYASRTADLSPTTRREVPWPECPDGSPR